MTERLTLRQTWLFWRAHLLRERGKKIVRAAMAQGRSLRDRAERLERQAKALGKPDGEGRGR